MPVRLLREGILTSERIDQLDAAAEVFYRRLMSKVDDHGLYDARPSILRSSLYPLRVDRVREADISRWIAACEKAGVIALYTYKAKPYLRMLDTRWTARSEPKYPLPPDPGCATLRSGENSCEQEKPTATLFGVVVGVDKDSEAKASAGKPAADLTKAELWEAGKSLLLAGGVPKGQCGSFVGKLVQDYGETVVVDAVRSAVVATPADPKEYLKATCMRLKGERGADHGKLITQPMNPATVAAQDAAKAEHDQRAAEIAAITPEQRAETARLVRERARGGLKAVS